MTHHDIIPIINNSRTFYVTSHSHTCKVVYKEGWGHTLDPRLEINHHLCHNFCALLEIVSDF